MSLACFKIGNIDLQSKVIDHAFSLKKLVQYIISGVIPVAAGILLMGEGGKIYKRLTGQYPSRAVGTVMLVVGFGVGKVVSVPIANRYGQDKRNPPDE